MRKLVTVALLLALAGCSSQGRVDGPVLTSPRPGLTDRGGFDAIVAGIVVYEADSNCLYLELDGVRNPVIWPAGTRWLEDPPAVVLTGGVRAEPGTAVQGGGGYLSVDHIRESVGDAVAVEVQRCADPAASVAFFNTGSRVELQE